MAKVQAELVLSIVMPPGHALSETELPQVRTGLGKLLSQAISNKPQPEAETDPALPPETDPDTADLTTVAQSDSPLPVIPVAPVPAPLPAIVPAPATVPVADNLNLPAAGDIAPAAAATVALTPETAPKKPVAPVPPTPAPAATEEKPAISPSIGPTIEAADDKSDAVLPQETAEPLARPESKEKKAPKAERPSSLPGEVNADRKMAAPAAAKSPVDPEVSARGADTSKPEAEAASQKASSRPTDPAAVVHAGRNDVDRPDSKSNASPAQPSAESTTNSPAPPAVLVTHAAPQQHAQPFVHQLGPADAVPIPGLAVEIAAHAQAGRNRFEIRLDPPELGRIDVRLDVDSSGQVTSHLRVDRAETLDLLRRDAPALERTLQQAGLKMSDSGLQFSLRDQSFSQHNQSRDMPAMARIVVPDETLASAETQRHYGRLAGIGSGVDIRV